jgi:hypothetical protein
MDAASYVRVRVRVDVTSYSYHCKLGPNTEGVAVGAGAWSSLIVTPAELVMISQQRMGGTVGKVCADIYVAKGVRGFFRGMGPSTLREMGWTGGLFGLYDAQF